MQLLQATSGILWTTGWLQGFYGLQQLHYGVQMESMLNVFCCVVFPFHYSISSFLHVHGNVPKCYPQMLGGAHFFIMHENKIHIGLKWDKPNYNSRQTIENTHWDKCFVGFCFKRKQGVLLKMLWMSLAYFMFLLPYNKVLL